jgi:hypothetical protein
MQHERYSFGISESISLFQKVFPPSKGKFYLYCPALKLNAKISPSASAPKFLLYSKQNN